MGGKIEKSTSSEVDFSGRKYEKEYIKSSAEELVSETMFCFYHDFSIAGVCVGHVTERRNSKEDSLCY